MNLWVVFLTGLTTGGLSCLAMQGGLLTSVIANQKDGELESTTKHDWLPVSLFLAAKLVSHTILGFFFGWLGSQLELDLGVRLFFQALAAVFMLATAANLLDLHPIFRYVVLQPPKFINRMVRNSTKSKVLFTPAFFGLLTVFIPCGVTQAMAVLAITSGSPLVGALIMFFFVLGTSPLFAAVGVATAKLSEHFQRRFLKLAAAALLFLGLSSLNGILVVLDAPITWNKATAPITYFFSEERFARAGTSQTEVVNGRQQVKIMVSSNGYSPKKIQVQAGAPVDLTLQTNETYTCATSFVLKAFNIKMLLGPTDTQTVAFTPTKPGKYTFSCSMGMYEGVLEVI